MGGADAFRFGPFELDAARGRLYRDAAPVALSRPQADILLALVSHAGEVVSRDSLIEIGWPDVHVSPNTVDQSMSRLRRTLGVQANAEPFIATATGAGYRFIAPV